jgi:hypothetical protein
MDSPISLSLNSKYSLPRFDDSSRPRLIGLGQDEAIAYYVNFRNHGHCRFVHLRNGRITCHELAIDPKNLKDEGRNRAWPVLLNIGDQLALLISTKLLCLLNMRLKVSARVKLDDPLPAVQEIYKADRFNQPSLANRSCCSDSNTVPVLFHGDWSNDVRYMAMLKVELAKEHAEWIRFGRKFLFSFKSSDFPTDFKIFPPHIYHAAYLKKRLYIYTTGDNSSYLKYGMHYFGLATYNGNCKQIAQPYMEKPSRRETKHRGRHGDFTSSGKYCIITPVFETSDPWKRKQRLYELSANELLECDVPRGYSKFKVVEHAHDTFWIASFEHKARDFDVASCSAQ